MSRRVDLDSPNLPDPKSVAWLEANNIDPSSVPAAQKALIDEEGLTLLFFIEDTDGGKILHENGNEWKKELRTVPLVSAPETFGL